MQSINNVNKQFFVESKADFDIIAITETSEQAENSFLSNVEMEGYSFFHTPTNSRKGGLPSMLTVITIPMRDLI